MSNTQGNNGSKLPFANTIGRYMTPVYVDGEALQQHVTTHFNTFHGLLCVRLLAFDKKFDEILQTQLATNDRLADFESNVWKSFIPLEDKIKQLIQVQAAELEVSPINGLQKQNERPTQYTLEKDDLSIQEGTVRGTHGHAVTLKALRGEFAASARAYRTNLYDVEVSDEEEDSEKEDEHADLEKYFSSPAALLPEWIEVLSFGIVAGMSGFLVSKFTSNY